MKPEPFVAADPPRPKSTLNRFTHRNYFPDRAMMKGACKAPQFQNLLSQTLSILASGVAEFQLHDGQRGKEWYSLRYRGPKGPDIGGCASRFVQQGEPP